MGKRYIGTAEIKKMECGKEYYVCIVKDRKSKKISSHITMFKRQIIKTISMLHNDMACGEVWRKKGNVDENELSGMDVYLPMELQNVVDGYAQCA